MKGLVSGVIELVIVLVIGLLVGVLLQAQTQKILVSPHQKTVDELQVQVNTLLEQLRQLSSTPGDSKTLELEIGTLDVQTVPEDDYNQRVVEAPRPFLCLMAPRLKNPANAEEVAVIGYVVIENLPTGPRLLYLQPKTLRYKKPPR